jgi:hypothetical protein
MYSIWLQPYHMRYDIIIYYACLTVYSIQCSRLLCYSRSTRYSMYYIYIHMAGFMVFAYIVELT